MPAAAARQAAAPIGGETLPAEDAATGAPCRPKARAAARPPGPQAFRPRAATRQRSISAARETMTSSSARLTAAQT